MSAEIDTYNEAKILVDDMARRFAEDFPLGTLELAKHWRARQIVKRGAEYFPKIGLRDHTRRTSSRLVSSEDMQSATQRNLSNVANTMACGVALDVVGAPVSAYSWQRLDQTIVDPDFGKISLREYCGDWAERYAQGVLAAVAISDASQSVTN